MPASQQRDDGVNDMECEDQHGKEFSNPEWNTLLGNDTLSTGQRIDTALACQIAVDVMRTYTTGDPAPTPWDSHDLKLACAQLNAVRAQQGVGGPDADILVGPGETFHATRQIDIWIYG